jgi:hypothetical protein
MEFAIPIIGLAGLYIVSNQNQKSENFANKNRNNAELLPNTDVPNTNFPDEYPIYSPDTQLTSKLSTTNVYDGPSVYTDKYFNNDANYGNTLPGHNNQPASYTSLTGQNVDVDYFRHNNMVPFFGAKSHINNAPNATESTLDNYNGQGSQIFSKKEIAPLFAPGDNYQWAYGTPNNTDFIKSRMNPSMKMSNIKPFEEIKVAPGLGLGYTAEGVGGYNSGLFAREQWTDKTVDELRVNNKQKASGFSMLGYEGPAGSHVTQRGDIGIMEKNRVDTTFAVGQDRLFTTTGVEKAPTMRAIPVERHVNRPETATNYAGVASYSNPANYVKGQYMDSTNIQLGPVPIQSAYGPGKSGAYDADYGIKAQHAYPNNRTANIQDDGYFGVVGGAIGATIAPILDILKPSRKENTIGNLRPYQNAKSTVENSYIFNPADRMAPTIRETTENSKFHLNVNSNQRGGAYEVTPNQPVHNARETTDNFYYAGGSSAGERGRQVRPYDAEYGQRNNDIKSSTINGRLVQGNMSLMNGDINVKSKPKDAYLANTRPVAATNLNFVSPSLDTFGKLQGTNELYQGIQYDRNNGDILSQLKGNPYTLNVVNGL